MSKIKALINQHSDTNLFKIIASGTLIAMIWILYSVHIWINTQSTDNAYLDGRITFVSPQVNGIIKKVNFIDNIEVKQGDVLVEIDDQDLKSKLNVAENAYESGKLQISIIESEIALEEINLSKAENEVSLSQSNLENSNTEFNRIAKLAHDNFSSKKLLDEASLNLKRARSEFEQKSLSLSSIKQNLIILGSKKNAQIFTTNALENQLQMAKNDFSEAKILAPIDGYITSSSARIGGYARAGIQLFAIVPKDNYYVHANFKETQVASFAPKQKAYVKFDSIPGKKFKAHLRNIYPATGSKFSLIPTDSATGNFTKIVQRIPVIFDVDIPEKYKNKITIGMSASVEIRTDQ